MTYEDQIHEFLMDSFQDDDGTPYRNMLDAIQEEVRGDLLSHGKGKEITINPENVIPGKTDTFVSAHIKYLVEQLKRVGDGDAKVKIKGEEGETHWLNVSQEQVLEIFQALAEDES